MLRITARSAFFHAKAATAAPARRSVQAKLALCLIYVLTVCFGLTISGDCWSQPGCFRKLMTALSEWILVSCICVFENRMRDRVRLLPAHALHMSKHAHNVDRFDRPVVIRVE